MSAQKAGKSLQKLVQDRLDELGVNEFSVTRREGVGVSYETLRAITRGTHAGNVTDRVARGLAATLNLPVAAILEAAGKPPHHGPWEWPPRFDVLPPNERRLVESFAAALAEARRQGAEERNRP